jgi:hypothetical protein
MSDQNQATQAQEQAEGHKEPALAERAGLHLGDADAAVETTTGKDPLDALAANDRAAQDRRDALGRIEPTMPSLDAFKDIALSECLEAIAALLNCKKEFVFPEYLAELSVLHKTETALTLKGNDNIYTLTPDSVEAEQDSISARAALEMGALIANNPKFNAERPLCLTGSPRDRYVLTLAAAALNLPVANPVSEAELPEELKAECAAIKAEIEALRADPAHNQVVADGQDILRDILSEAPEVTEEAVADAVPSALKETDQDHYKKAVELVTETNQASKAHLQRSLNIGFNRASRLISELENQGIVTATKSGKYEVHTPALAPV